MPGQAGALDQAGALELEQSRTAHRCPGLHSPALSAAPSGGERLADVHWFSKISGKFSAVLESRCRLFATMPRGLRWLGTGLLLRGLIAELRALRQEVHRQGDALERLATQFAPAELPPLQATGEQPLESITYVDPVEMALVEDYIQKVELEMGQPPSEEQILDYLADEKTVELHARLKERADVWQERFQRKAEGRA